jgi:hypothetical protein
MDSSCFLLATLVSSAWDIPVRLYNKGKAESELHLRTLIGDISPITHKGAAPMNVAEHIISLERSALDRWVRGDPNGYLTLCGKDATYFDLFREKQLMDTSPDARLINLVLE